MDRRPELGPLDRIAHYRLNVADVEGITRRRDAMVSKGSPVKVGDTLPLLITAVHDQEHDEAHVSGQVVLDGEDTWWVRDVARGVKAGTFQPA